MSQNDSRASGIWGASSVFLSYFNVYFLERDSRSSGGAEMERGT